jgi:hypothetical protein
MKKLTWLLLGIPLALLCMAQVGPPGMVSGGAGGGGGGSVPATSALGNQTGSITITPVQFGTTTLTLTGNVTATLGTLADNERFTISVTQTGTNTYTFSVVAPGGYTLAWPNAITPVQTTGAHTDDYSFHVYGTTLIHGAYQQNY